MSSIVENIRAQMPGTTVAQKPHQGTHPKTGGNRFRVPFLGTFLGKQKSTKHFLCNNELPVHKH